MTRMMLTVSVYVSGALSGVSRACAVGVMLLANHAAAAQITEVANGNASEDSEIVEIEADGSLDDTTGSLDVAATDHRFAANVDVRTGYSDLDSDDRDGGSSGADSFRARWRLQGVYNVTDRLRLGGRIAGICSDFECEPTFVSDSSIPTQNGLSDGDIAIDTLFIHRFRNERYDVAAGRLQTKFVARGGIFSKSLDRNDSNNMRVNWTDGVHGTYRARKGWVSHGILQYNSASGSGSVRRGPLDFTNPDSRVTYFYGIENLEPQRNLLQRGFDITYLPKSLMIDGTTSGRVDDYWGLVARVAGRWPRRSEGPRLRFSSELGYAPKTQTRAAANLEGTGDVDGWAWNVTASIMEFLPAQSIGFNYGRTDPGWLLSPQYGSNEELYEIRYSWRRDAHFALDIRVRRRTDLEQRINTIRKREVHDFFVRFTWGFASNT